MGRKIRIEYENAFYHVFSRGNNKKNIFKTVADKRKFLGIIGEAYCKYGILIHSYVLMNNHYHMIIETPQANLSKAMQYINFAYANYFNYTNQAVGHLFQSRYKALLINKEEYLLPLSRYIHLNPVKANYTRDPENYTWSSFKSFLQDFNYKWLIKKILLNAIGGKEKYRKYVMDFKKEKNENIFTKINKQTFLRDDAFSAKTEDAFCKNKNVFPDNELSCENIVDFIKNRFEISVEKITTKNAYSSKHRKLAIYLCKKYARENNIEIGKYFGGIHPSNVSNYFREFEKELKTNNEYLKTIIFFAKKHAL